jgi:peptidoglycan biosynthesis protein MviN/MurJ (putative lipid II flippase)
VLRQLRELVKQKDNLDFQYAMQATLKCWLFMHVPLTYGLLLFAALHVLVVYAYRG